MQSSKVTLHLSQDYVVGDRIQVGGGNLPNGWDSFDGDITSLRVGLHLVGEGGAFRVLALGWLPTEKASSRTMLLEAVTTVKAGDGEYVPTFVNRSLAWITLSDKGAAGKRTDESGPLIGELVSEQLGLESVQGFIIPDEADALKALLVELSLEQRFDLIVTTGGTGVGERDITPEATLAVIEKRLPGYERAMTAASLSKTPHGAISRAVAGTLGRSLIVNMPGSPKAVAECLEPLLPTLKHTLDKLQGDPTDCAELYK